MKMGHFFCEYTPDIISLLVKSISEMIDNFD